MTSSVDDLLQRLDNAAVSGEFSVFVELAETIATTTIEGYSSPFFPYAAPMTPADLRRAREALVAFIADNPDSPAVASAFWCLGKLFDPSLKSYFDQQLAACLRRGPESEVETIEQLLIALSNLGVDDLDASALPAVEDGSTLREARAYAERLNGNGTAV